MGQSTAFGNCYHPTAPPHGGFAECPTRLSAGDLRPLLCGVEQHFAKMADSNGEISAHNLAQVWQECAQRKLGSLSHGDLDTIRQGVDSYVETKCIAPAGQVNCADFVSFLLDGTEGYMCDGTLTSRLRKMMLDNPARFQEKLLDFATRVQEPRDSTSKALGLLNPVRGALDQTCVTRTEFAQCLIEMLPDCRDGVEYPPAGGPFELANNLFQVLGAPHEGVIDLYKAFAFILDRRKTAVELVLYDISHGASRLFSKALLGRKFEAIYHSSVLAFGTEFWYGGQIFENQPPIDPGTFGPPLSESLEQLKPSVYNKEIKVVNLGSTLATLHEFRDFLQKHIKPNYRPENYDVLACNCNHFSDEAVRFLTGNGIPENVRRLPELVMDTPGVQLIRPFLNRWLSAFQADSNKAKITPGEKQDESDDEDFQTWEEAAARFDGDTIDLGYFDPTVNENLTRKPGRKNSIMREESGRLIRPKSGESVTLKVVEKQQERKEIRRSAIRRLVDGRFVHAKTV